jgi:hypothetical protein
LNGWQNHSVGPDPAPFADANGLSRQVTIQVCGIVVGTDHFDSRRPNGSVPDLNAIRRLVVAVAADHETDLDSAPDLDPLGHRDAGREVHGPRHTAIAPEHTLKNETDQRDGPAASVEQAVSEQEPAAPRERRDVFQERSDAHVTRAAGWLLLKSSRTSVSCSRNPKAKTAM